MPGKRSIERDIGLTLSCRFLGSDDNDTIGSTSTIDGSSSSIFKNSNTLNIIHIQIRDFLGNITSSIAGQLSFLYWKAIYDIERRSRGIHRGYATNHAVIISGNLASQHSREITQPLVFQFISCYLGKSTGCTLLRDCLITRYNHFTKYGFIFRHHNLHMIPTSHLYLLVIHTDIRNRNLMTSFRNIKLKITIRISHGSKRTARHYNRSANHRFSILIGNCS